MCPLPRISVHVGEIRQEYSPCDSRDRPRKLIPFAVLKGLLLSKGSVPGPGRLRAEGLHPFERGMH